MCSLAWNENFTFICVLPVQFSHSLMHEYHNVSLSPSLFLSFSLSHSCHVAAYDDTQKGVTKPLDLPVQAPRNRGPLTTSQAQSLPQIQFHSSLSCCLSPLL